MRMRTVITVALMMGAALWVLPAAAQPASDEAKIRALEGQFAAAFNAKDVDAIMKVYVPDESLVVFDVVPPRQYVGAKAYRKDWQDFFASVKGPLKFEISDLSVTAAGPLGYGHSIQRISGTDAKGQPIDLTVRVTDVYRKIKGNWLIVHEHVSIPVDLDTGKPDLSSKP
jgi:ketosteroid isomerase-like protein